MPKRTDINKIMIIGSGPIVIGQACEFDYSGTQACKALKEEGYDVILINSNPATIMTDFGVADRTYIEPITSEIVTKVIEKERPDVILPTLGGQIGLNTVMELSRFGIIEKLGIELIGVSLESIVRAEFRQKFKKAMEEINLKIPRSGIANTFEEAILVQKKIGFPLLVRASFTMGGAGSCIVNNFDDFKKDVLIALRTSMVSQVILEEFLINWKEYELELLRDCANNVIVVCSIENFDPIGIHTGDSITVAPVQTLTDLEYQKMRDAAIAIIKKIGIESGGANVQFAINPISGDMVVIEMNPRVSRSSALASKATGFPIAKIAAKLAVGYTLDEIKNDITGKTMVCFEPSLDYCIVKIPAWDFEKFPESDDTLSTSMKSVGETMAIGRTFKEAVQKAMRSLGDTGYSFGLDLLKNAKNYKGLCDEKEIMKKLKIATSKRLLYIYCAFYFNMKVKDISKITGIDKWFIFQIYQIFEFEMLFRKTLRLSHNNVNKNKMFKTYKNILLESKVIGFSDKQISNFMGISESKIADYRLSMGITPVYKSVDTCAGEFRASSPYYYSSYESECEIEFPIMSKKIIILGSGPNRIGQGIEFDYCCVHASLALREEKIESIMINSNPETVSTDYDISDRLYFEPLTYEDVMHVVFKEKPDGVIVQFGGQIPLNLSDSLKKAGVSILGTQPNSINRTEDRGLFHKMLAGLGIKHPNSIMVTSTEQAINAAESIGYPLMVSPSFVLGGKAVNIAYNKKSLISFAKMALSVSYDKSILIDEFLEKAIEIDVDVISDGINIIICGIMEHIEEAGIHSGDSACVFPTQTISVDMLCEIKEITKIMALELQVVGFMNVQFAVKRNKLYVIEVNLRASRSIPFISKARGIPFANIATKVILGEKIINLGLCKPIKIDHVAVKESVFPFDKFVDSSVLLNPSMKSTGEVMGIGSTFASAYLKAQISAGQKLPLVGRVFIDFFEKNKSDIAFLINEFSKLGFDVLMCNYNDLDYVTQMEVNLIFMRYSKIISNVENNSVQLVITVGIVGKQYDLGYEVCKTALRAKVPYITTFRGALAACKAIKLLKNQKQFHVKALQDYHV